MSAKTERNGAAPNKALFARKGEATPAPAVGYVSVRVLQGGHERRSEERPYDGPDRRRSTFERLFGTRSQAPPAPEVRPEAPEKTAPEREPGIRSALSLLIQRHGAAPAPRPVPAAPQRDEATPRRPLPTPKTRIPPPPPARPARRGKRRQLTLRLYPGDHRRFKALAKRTGRTNQDVLAAAVIAYLE